MAQQIHSIAKQESRPGASGASYLYTTDITCLCGEVFHGAGIPSARDAFAEHRIMEDEYVKAAWSELRVEAGRFEGLLEAEPGYRELVRWIRRAIVSQI